MKSTLSLLLTGTIAGAVVLAIADAPGSLGMFFRIGPDHPDYAGYQVLVGLAGALATAIAVMLAQHWRWLLTAGALGVLLSRIGHNPAMQGITVRPAEPGPGPELLELVEYLPWTMLGLAASGVLLVGLFGAAQRLWHIHPAGASATTVIATAGYVGVAVIGPLKAPDAGTARLVVLAVAVLLVAIVWLAPDSDETALEPSARIAAATVACLTVAPTILVAVTDEMAFGTWQGGLIGVLLLGAAVIAATTLGRNALLAVTAIGFVLAGLAIPLILFADALLYWGEEPVGVLVLLAAVVAAALSALRARIVIASVLALATSVLLALLITNTADSAGAAMIWAFLPLAIAAAGMTVGSTTQLFAPRGTLPAAAAVITAMAIGVHATTNFLRIGGNGALEGAVSTGGMLISAGLLLIAAILLLLLYRADQVRPGAPPGDYRRVLTTVDLPADPR